MDASLLAWAVLRFAGSLGRRSVEVARDKIISDLELRTYKAAKSTLYPLIVGSPNKDGIILPRSMMIDEPILTIGSAPNAHLRHPSFPYVWGHIVRADNAFLIHQVAETSTLLRVDGQPMPRHYLQQGDLFAIGGVPMIFGQSSRRAIESFSPDIARASGTYGLASPVETPTNPPLPLLEVAIPSGSTIGTVKWFNSEKGYGFISVDGSADVFLHYTAIIMPGYRNVEEGQRVMLRIIPGPKGPQAEDVRPLSGGYY